MEPKDGQQGGEPTPKTNDGNAEVQALKNQIVELQGAFDEYKLAQKDVRVSVKGQMTKEINTKWENDLKTLYGIEEDLRGNELLEKISEIKGGMNPKPQEPKPNEELEALREKLRLEKEKWAKLVEDKETELKTYKQQTTTQKVESAIKTVAEIQLKKKYELHEKDAVNLSRLDAAVKLIGTNVRFNEEPDPVMLDEDGTPIYVDGKKLHLSKLVGEKLDLFFDKKTEQANPLQQIGTTGKKVVVQDSIEQLRKKLNSTTSGEEYDKILTQIEALEAKM